MTAKIPRAEFDETFNQLTDAIERQKRELASVSGKYVIIWHNCFLRITGDKIGMFGAKPYANISKKLMEQMAEAFRRTATDKTQEDEEVTVRLADDFLIEFTASQDEFMARMAKNRPAV